MKEGASQRSVTCPADTSRVVGDCWFVCFVCLTKIRDTPLLLGGESQRNVKVSARRSGERPRYSHMCEEGSMCSRTVSW